MKAQWEKIKWGGAAMGEWLLVAAELIIIAATWD